MGYTNLNLGLSLVIPTSGTRNWGGTLLSSTWSKISSHDHSGSGNGNPIPTAGIADASITSAKLAPNIALDEFSFSVTGASPTAAVNFNNGNIQFIDVTAATGTVTVTFSNQQVGAEYQLYFIRPNASLPTVFSSPIRWAQGVAPIWTQASGSPRDLVKLYIANGAIYGEWEPNF